MNDGQCDRCGTKISWKGEIVDMPACPRCGHMSSPEDLAHDQQMIDEFAKMLLEKKCSSTNASTKGDDVG
jgi:hypothetical protein